MGRAKREVPTGRLRLKYPKGEYDKNKKYTLYYYYSCNRIAITRDTQLRVKVCDWNENANNGRGGLKASYGNDYIRCNNMLEDFLRDKDGKIREYNLKYPNKINPDIVKAILKDEPTTRADEGRDFVEFVLECLKKESEIGKIGHSKYENGISAMKGFKNFLTAEKKGTYKTDSIYLGEINGDIIDDYIIFRKTIKENRASTINHALTPIIKACKKACDKGYISNDVYLEIKDKRLTDSASALEHDGFDGKFLTKEEIEKLVVFYENDCEQRRKEYVEMFLFAFHAAGFRIIDIMTLQWKHVNFEKKEIRKIQIKTIRNQKPRHTVPLTDTALKILERWQKMKRRERFVFDLLDDNVDITNQETLYKVRNSATKKVNQALRVVGECIGLKFNLSFHVARHSFAINALNHETKPLNMYQVSRLLGHSSTEITERVYADYTNDYLGDRLKELNFNFLPNFD